MGFLTWTITKFLLYVHFQNNMGNINIISIDCKIGSQNDRSLQFFSYVDRNKNSNYLPTTEDDLITSGTSIGEGNGSPLQYSCLENPMDGGAL